MPTQTHIEELVATLAFLSPEEANWVAKAAEGAGPEGQARIVEILTQAQEDQRDMLGRRVQEDSGFSSGLLRTLHDSFVAAKRDYEREEQQKADVFPDLPSA
jgi:hypothetical protein